MTVQILEQMMDTNVYVYSSPNTRDFYKDLLDLFELEDNGISRKMYSLAWKNGHSSGLREVYYHFVDLVEVFKK